MPFFRGRRQSRLRSKNHRLGAFPAESPPKTKTSTSSTSSSPLRIVATTATPASVASTAASTPSSSTRSHNSTPRTTPPPTTSRTTAATAYNSYASPPPPASTTSTSIDNGNSHKHLLQLHRLRKEREELLSRNLELEDFVSTVQVQLNKCDSALGSNDAVRAGTGLYPDNDDPIIATLNTIASNGDDDEDGKGTAPIRHLWHAGDVWNSETTSAITEATTAVLSQHEDDDDDTLHVDNTLCRLQDKLGRVVATLTLNQQRHSHHEEEEERLTVTHNNNDEFERLWQQLSQEDGRQPEQEEKRQQNQQKMQSVKEVVDIKHLPPIKEEIRLLPLTDVSKVMKQLQSRIDSLEHENKELLKLKLQQQQTSKPLDFGTAFASDTTTEAAAAATNSEGGKRQEPQEQQHHKLFQELQTRHDLLQDNYDSVQQELDDAMCHVQDLMNVNRKLLETMTEEREQFQTLEKEALRLLAEFDVLDGERERLTTILNSKDDAVLIMMQHETTLKTKIRKLEDEVEDLKAKIQQYEKHKQWVDNTSWPLKPKSSFSLEEEEGEQEVSSNKIEGELRHRCRNLQHQCLSYTAKIQDLQTELETQKKNAEETATAASANAAHNSESVRQLQQRCDAQALKIQRLEQELKDSVTRKGKESSGNVTVKKATSEASSSSGIFRLQKRCDSQMSRIQELEKELKEHQKRNTANAKITKKEQTQTNPGGSSTQQQQQQLEKKCNELEIRLKRQATEMKQLTIMAVAQVEEERLKLERTCQGQAQELARLKKESTA